MFLLFAAGCTAPTDDPVKTPDHEAPTPASELSRAGCESVLTAASSEGVIAETCTISFDHEGRDVGYDCLAYEGSVWQAEGAYDEAGCYVYDRLYVTSPEWGGSLEEIGITCDAHLNSVTEVGTYEQYDAAGAVEYAGDFRRTYINTYADDLLVESLQEDGTGDPYLTTYAYDDAGRLTWRQGGPLEGRVSYETSYAYDDAGNLVRTETESRYGDATWEAEYDAFARVVRSEQWSENDDRTSVTLTEWEGDTLRQVRAQVDPTNDGTFENVHDYVWTCP